MVTLLAFLALIQFGSASEPLVPDHGDPSGDSLLLEEHLRPQTSSGNDCYSGEGFSSKTPQSWQEPGHLHTSSSGEEPKEFVSSADDMQPSSGLGLFSKNHPINVIDIVLDWPDFCWGITYCDTLFTHSFNGCYCDDSCELYRDCCSDYNSKFSHTMENHYQFGCVNIRPQLPNAAPDAKDQYIKVIDACPQSWLLSENGTHNATTMCSSYDGILPPVTDLSTNITYKNMFCAFCNKITNTSIWSLMLRSSKIATPNMNLTEVINMFEAVSFVPPTDILVHECFPKHITETCPSYEESEQTSYETYSWLVKECGRYQRVVEADSKLYRNEHCALCNGQYRLKVYINQDCIPEITIPKLVIDIGNTPLATKTDIITIGMFPLDKMDMQVLICGDNEVFDQEQMICRETSTNQTECISGVPITLEEDEFEYVGKDWVSLNGELLKVQLNSSEGLPVVCVNYSQNGSISTTTRGFMYPIGFDYLTYIGCILSLAGYSLVLITFCTFKELRTLPTKILMCISITSIGFNILTLSAVSGAGENAKFCQAVAIGLHFFILGQFTWMTVMCIEMVYTFYMASRLRPVQADASQKRFCVYSAVSWTLPILFVSGVITANYTNSELVQYGWNDETENQNCWINDFNSAVVVFIAPMLALALLQLILFLIVGVLIYSSHAKKSTNASRSGKSIPYFRILLGLFFASNIMWVFGFMAIWIGIEWAWYPFNILLGSQGPIIFLGFFGTKKVLKLYVATCTTIKNRYITFRSTKNTSV